MKQRHCLALDLKPDESLIEDYEKCHAPGAVWPEILDSIRDAGIEVLEIYRTGNRLFMILEAGEDFSFEKKASLDAANPAVQQWENKMWEYQQALPWAAVGQKWLTMKKIFEL